MTFFLDLWHDLREKRLWPVAVGLLAAMVAIPLILLKPAGGPPPPTAVVADSGKAETLPAVSVDLKPIHGSKLETFSTRDPFKPLSDLKKEEVPADETTDAGTAGGGSAPGGSAGSGGDSVGSTGGGSTSTGGGTTGDTSPTTPTTPSESELQWFRYAVDVKFGEPGSQDTMKRVPRLASLPDDDSPAVVFMGVSDDGERASFYVADASLNADGEGECEGDSCRIVTLGLDGGSDEETFTSSDGSVQYDLQLLRIRRETMDEPSAKQAADSDDEEALGKAAAGAADKSMVIGDADYLPLMLAGSDVALGTE